MPEPEPEPELEVPSEFCGEMSTIMAADFGRILKATSTYRKPTINYRFNLRLIRASWDARSSELLMKGMLYDAAVASVVLDGVLTGF